MSERLRGYQRLDTVTFQRRKLPVTNSAWEGFFIRTGLLGTVGLIAIVWSMTLADETDAGSAAFVAASEPAIAPAAGMVDPLAATYYPCTDIIPTRPVDVRLEETYYFAGELDSNPTSLTGTAHYYGGGEPLNAHTASGERFDPDDYTAASWFYNLGTRVQVTDLKSGGGIMVKINDRGPNRVGKSHWKDIVIDLSRAAFRFLNPNPNVGSLNVQVDPLPCIP